MAQEDLGKCNHCRGHEGHHTDSCPLEESTGVNGEDCNECGLYLVGMYGVKHCHEHLTGQELVDYVIALKESHKNIVDGGVEALKERDREIDRLKTANAELVKGFNKQTAHINRLLAKDFGIKLPKGA